VEQQEPDRREQRSQAGLLRPAQALAPVKLKLPCAAE
jgi:hypothetical protein